MGIQPACAAGVCFRKSKAEYPSRWRQYGWFTEKAQQIAAHESPRTTKLYDRTDDRLSLDGIEKIQI
jgi:hypothetical protein